MLLHYNSRPLQELSKYLKYETSVLNKSFNSGLSNCSWSSCREGCTRDIFSCHHILVEYTYLQEDYRIMKLLREKQGLLDPSPTKHSAVLFVNVKVRRLISLLNILTLFHPWACKYTHVLVCTSLTSNILQFLTDLTLILVSKDMSDCLRVLNSLI